MAAEDEEPRGGMRKLLCRSDGDGKSGDQARNCARHQRVRRSADRKRAHERRRTCPERFAGDQAAAQPERRPVCVCRSLVDLLVHGQ